MPIISVENLSKSYRHGVAGEPKPSLTAQGVKAGPKALIRPPYASCPPSSVLRLFSLSVPGLIKDVVRTLVDAGLELLGLALPGEGRKIVEQCFDGWHHWDRQFLTMER